MKRPVVEHFTPRNTARVRMPQPDGKYNVIYLGKWGSAEAQQKHHEIIANPVTVNQNAGKTTTSLRLLCTNNPGTVATGRSDIDSNVVGELS